MKTMLTLNYLKAVSYAINSKEPRYYLNGVSVEVSQNGTILTATNGHMLLSAHDETNTSDEPFSLIIPQTTIKAIKPQKFQNEIELSTDDGKTWRLGNIIFEPVDGTFPDWRRIIPTHTPVAPNVENVWFNPEYQQALAKAGKELNDTPVFHPDGENAAIVTFANPDLIGIIMPMRITRPKIIMPPWTKPDWATTKKTEA